MQVAWKKNIRIRLFHSEKLHSNNQALSNIKLIFLSYNMNIYVGNLDFKVDENDLKGIFGEYGSVNDVKIITDKYSGRSKGFGFVTMDNSTDGKKAITELNGATIENRQIVVNEAREKRQSNFRWS